MIVIAADTLVAARLVAELAAARVQAAVADDPDALKAAPRQPIVLIAGSGPPGAEIERDQAQRRAARVNGGDTFEVSLADLQERPDAIMRHLAMFAEVTRDL